MAGQVFPALPPNTPAEVRRRAEDPPRVPTFDPTLGVRVELPKNGTPPHRLVAIGDSLTHGFQSGAIFNTELSYPAIIAYELGWLDRFRYPRYLGFGGLPLNIELLVRELESRFGAALSAWEIPLALFAARDLMDRIEDHWERGPGSVVPTVNAINHALAVYGWDLRDALSRTFNICRSRIATPKDDLVKQVVQNNGDRAALHVYPHWSDETKDMTLFEAAAELGRDHDENTECGIETLIVFLGANNALKAVTNLNVAWSDNGFRDLGAKENYTVWRPSHFREEFDEVVDVVKRIGARHVIFCTVPHVTIPPISRGIGQKLEPGSPYFPYYTRPWVKDADFSHLQDKHITGAEAYAVDLAIDMFNETIEEAVRSARKGSDGTVRDWYLLDTSGLLDRMAARRYINDPNARPEWWTPYPLPPTLNALNPPVDSRFLAGDGQGGRGAGGLFSLDGVHPTTICYGILAQETITIMRSAGVEFGRGNGAQRPDPITVDFERLLLLDSLVQRPPQNVTPTLDILAWADERLDWIKRTLSISG
jgi:hypothetical protein